MKLSDIKDYLNTLLASFSAVLDLELTILRSEPLERVAATGEWYNSDIVCYENGRLIPQWQNSYTMKVNKRKLENAKSSDTKETLEKTIREDTQSIGASVTSSYQNVLAAKASMELKQAQAQLQEKSMQTTERQYHLGMIGRLDYLNRKYAYDSAVIQTQIAKYNLLQAIQSYEWVLDGLANAS